MKINTYRLDLKFYRQAYPDVRFLLDFQLEQHYTSQGRSENRLRCEQELRDFLNSLEHAFDCSFYKKHYPDVPSSDLHASVHYYMFGFKEGRLYNPVLLPKSDYERKYKTIKTDTNQPVPNNHTTFNILLEPTDEEGFEHKIRSILSQKYKNYHVHILIENVNKNNHVLSCSNENFHFYIKSRDVISDQYSLLKYITTGWFIDLTYSNSFNIDSVLNQADHIIHKHRDYKVVKIYDYIFVDSDIKHRVCNKHDYLDKVFKEYFRPVP